MARKLRLSKRAEGSLTSIARWTVEQFGARQADIYEAQLLDRCEALLGGHVVSRSCAVLVNGAQDLRFVRVGEHYLVFLERPDEIIIVDILHSRSDLPRHVAALRASPKDKLRN